MTISAAIRAVIGKNFIKFQSKLVLHQKYTYIRQKSIFEISCHQKRSENQFGYFSVRYFHAESPIFEFCIIVMEIHLLLYTSHYFL